MILARLRQEVARSSQGVVAGAIGVEPSAISRWLSGTRPVGKNLLLLIEWAEEDRIRRERADLVRDEAVNFKPSTGDRSGDFYDGILHSLSVFNRASGELIAEVQRWRERSRRTKAAPEPWVTNQVFDGDVEVLEGVQQKVAAGKRSKPKKKVSESNEGG